MSGLDVRAVRVEVSITRGTPLIQFVGLAQSAVREGRERIRAAASQLGIPVPGLRITVNLAPADLPKTGAAFDLPIMLGILAADGVVPADALAGWLVAGELGLDGRVRSIRGTLPIALHAADSDDVDRLLVPRANLREGAAAAGIDVRGARSLEDVVAAFARGGELDGRDALGEAPPGGPSAAPEADLAHVRGQAHAKRALEIAAAGGHNLLMSGVPGAGKTSLARCLPGLLPELSTAEAVEVTAIHSVAGLLPDEAGLARTRPFRAPHHTVSQAGMIGGGSWPRPGEASLAHRGVLFLDELPEFGRATLEALRQPLEEGAVRIVRARMSARFPSRFALVAAMNPCPCGYHGVAGRCRCGDEMVLRYRRRLSGPLLDRIDLHVDVPAVAWDDLVGNRREEPSDVVRARVAAARRRARVRAAARGGAAAEGVNARLPARSLEATCRLDGGGRALLRRAVCRLGLTARGYHRTLRIARTIADLAGEESVGDAAVAEAIGYRAPEPARGFV